MTGMIGSLGQLGALCRPLVSIKADVQKYNLKLINQKRKAALTNDG
jgi:hypothetical protein